MKRCKSLREAERLHRLAANIRGRMEKAGMNRLQLAVAAGTTWTQVDAIVRGIRVPTVQTLFRLAQAMQCRPADFFAGIR